MPGRRNLARERAAHAASVAERQASLYAMLRAQLPDKDHALVGWPAILRFFARLGICRRNGDPLTRRMLRRWHHRHELPLLRGNAFGKTRTPCLTTTFALTAWLLSRLDTDGSFRVSQRRAFTPVGNFPSKHADLGRSAA